MADAQIAGADTSFVSAEELVERARAMIPVVRERAAHAEELRRLPPETVEDFKSNGFIRALQPVRFGGMDHDFEVSLDVAMQVARGCGASGWLASFMALHQYMVGWFSEQAQEEYFATNGPNTLSSTVSAQRFARTVVDGGIRLSGEAKFSSGVDYADWGLVHTSEETCLVPREDFEIIDDWDVEGLSGTGSKGVRIRDVFVPDYRRVTYEQSLNGTAPGAALTDSPWHHVQNPLVLVLNHAIMAPVIGMGRGVLEIFDARARTRVDPSTFLPAIERAGPQLRYAEASAELDAAENFLRTNITLVRQAGIDRQPLTLEQRAKVRRNVTYAGKLVLQATGRLVDGQDSSALFKTNYLHRQARDTRAGALQFVMQWEETAIQYARVHWGLEPNTRLI